MSFNPGLTTSLSPEWATPQDLFDQISERLGPFTLDACATPENAKCAHYYTQEEDGLSQSWALETVYCNPPYGRAIGRWMAKAYQESLLGATAVCLIPARTDARWWHTWVMRARTIYLIRGRVRFEGQQQGSGAAPFPSAIVIFGQPTGLGPEFCSWPYPAKAVRQGAFEL